MPLPDPVPVFPAGPTLRDGAAEGLLLRPEAPDDRFEFVEALRMGVLASLELASSIDGRPTSVFVLSHRPREVAVAFGAASRVYDLDLNGPEQWEGMLVFAARQATNGWAVPMPAGGLQGALDLLIAHGQGDAALAVVYPSKRTLSFSAEGATTNSASLRLALPAGTKTVTLKDLTEILEVLRTEALVTPAVCPPILWADAANYVPSTETERLLQWCVASELRAHFRPMLAEREQVTPIGRIDICLTDLRAGATLRHPAVIELKALRSKSSSGKKVDERDSVAAVAGGLRQAKAYRVKKQAGVGLLACFDLRQAKTDLLAHETVKRAHGRYFDSCMAVSILPIFGAPADAQDEIAVA